MAGSLPHTACGGVLLLAVKLEIAFVERRGEEALTASVGLQSQRWSTACSRSEGKAGLEPIKAVGQNSSYYAVIWNCLEDMIYFGLYWFQLV